MRILLADSRAKVRFALRVLLERQPGFQVVGEVATPQDLPSQTASLHPDLVLLDWELARPSAADLLLALRRECPGLVVIALSGRPGLHREALAAGADDFVSKGQPPTLLLAAINRCCCGDQADTGGQGISGEDALAI